jgi:predicted neuraminidase
MTQLDSYRSISRDGGLTWSCPNSIPGGIHHGAWVNSGIVHSSGRWIIPVSWAEHCGAEWCEPSIGRPPASVVAGPGARQPVELPWGADKSLLYQTANAWADRNHRYVAGVMLSDDEGATFRLRGYLCRDDARHFIEPKVVELSDGRVTLFAREKWQGWIWRSESTDGGETWSPIQRTDIPNPSSKFRLLRANDGRIFLLHNPAGIQPDGKWGRRSPLSLWISDDDMRTWQTKVDLIADTERNLNYPDGFLDEERGEVRFAWEDAYSVYIAAVPMDVT